MVRFKCPKTLTSVETLPHEDRAYGGQFLYIDLVPRSCFFSNARSHLSRTDWTRLREFLYARAGYRCEICGTSRDAGARRRLDAHERWLFDEYTHIQRLVRLIALCEPCHSATHYGLAELHGAGIRAFTQLRTVNGWTEQQTQQHIVRAFAQWRARNEMEWTLDLTLLADAGFSIINNNASPDRAEHAERRMTARS